MVAALCDGLPKSYVSVSTWVELFEEQTNIPFFYPIDLEINPPNAWYPKNEPQGRFST